MNDHRITNLDFTQNELLPDQYSATQQLEDLTNITENDYGGDDTMTSTASAVALAGPPTSSAGLRKTHQNASTQPRECLRRYQTSVWDAYRKHFDVKLNGPVEVAVRRADPSMLVIVRQAAATDIRSRGKELTRLMKQPYFVQCWELYAADPVPHLVCEYMSISLVHVVGLPVFPSEAELAAIAGQVGRRPHRRPRLILIADQCSRFPRTTSDVPSKIDHIQGPAQFGGIGQDR